MAEIPILKFGTLSFQAPIYGVFCRLIKLPISVFLVGSQTGSDCCKKPLKTTVQKPMMSLAAANEINVDAAEATV